MQETGTHYGVKYHVWKDDNYPQWYYAIETYGDYLESDDHYDSMNEAIDACDGKIELMLDRQIGG